MGSLSARLLGVHLVLETRQVNRSELNRVVAAVMQDINDVWYITETTDVFDRLKDVPIGLLPMTVRDDSRGRRRPGAGSPTASGQQDVAGCTARPRHVRRARPRGPAAYSRPTLSMACSAAWRSRTTRRRGRRVVAAEPGRV